MYNNRTCITKLKKSLEMGNLVKFLFSQVLVPFAGAVAETVKIIIKFWWPWSWSWLSWSGWWSWSSTCQKSSLCSASFAALSLKMPGVDIAQTLGLQLHRDVLQDQVLSSSSSPSSSSSSLGHGRPSAGNGLAGSSGGDQFGRKKLLIFHYWGTRALRALGLDGIVGWWPVRE